MNGRISARVVSVVALGSVLLTGTSCLRETPGHCAFEEGDRTCEAAYEGTFCIFQGPGFLDFAGEKFRNVSEAQRLGCYESRPMTSEGEDMGTDRKFFGCVRDRLVEGEDLLGDLRALLNGTKDGKTYDLAAFLDGHGVTEEAHELGCRPGSGSTTTEAIDSSSTITGSEGSTTDGVSSESSTTGGMPCRGNDDCTDTAPFCDPVTETCVESCDGLEDPDGACMELPLTPLCGGGACVQCTPDNTVACDEDLLVCDSMGACVACTEHAQCGSSGACELAVGLCFPSGAVRFAVDGDGGVDHTSIVSAIDAVPNNGHGVILVHELDGGADYGPTITSGDNKTIALLAAPGEVPIIQGNSTPGLRVTGMGTTLYMDGLTLAGNLMGVGLRVDDDAFAWVDRSRIVQNSGGGILVEDGAALTLRNSFVGLNGNQLADTRGITVAGATVDILYTTVAANDGTGASGPISLSCDATATGAVRNSIVAAGTGTIECPEGVSFSFSVVDTAGLAGSDNEVFTFDPSWFPSGALADFHIDLGPPFADVAQWSTGDPGTDIDGDARPTMDGAPDYAGADVP